MYVCNGMVCNVMVWYVMYVMFVMYVMYAMYVCM